MMKLAVLIPCYNEEAAIPSVVKEFQKTLPDAEIYVYDNNSTDKTTEAATKAGAIVRFEPLQGKGNVVRRMFSDIEADIYLMIDGDGSYDIPSAPKMINLLKENNLDMVVGTRDDSKGVHRAGHAFGNKIFNLILKLCFGGKFSDIFSGYRVFSKRFVKSFPALTRGFDIESEISIHSLELNLPCAEIPTPFHERFEGTHSKLSTVKDGFKILWRILSLLKEVRPFYLFGMISLFFAIVGTGLFIPILSQYLESGLVPKMPTLIVVTGIFVIAALNLFTGIILGSISSTKREIKKLFYLNKS
ncbi:MAG: glycosyltransferase [Candidatus Paracaedibacteraceae bacterium]|nr:glycosyltransferase [Candidatus Paracaedibacteraceae bacterium]